MHLFKMIDKVLPFCPLWWAAHQEHYSSLRGEKSLMALVSVSV